MLKSNIYCVKHFILKFCHYFNFVFFITLFINCLFDKYSLGGTTQ